jgi:hypothetical protein
MARIKDKHIIGVIGPVVYKMYRETQVITIKPGKVKQTENTRKCSVIFAHAIDLSNAFKDKFSQHLHDYQDGTMYNRMTSVMSRILYEFNDPDTMMYDFNADSFKSLQDFDFNKDSPLINSLRVKAIASVTGDILTVTLPELMIPAQLKFPAGSKCCKVTISPVLFTLRENARPRAIDHQSFVIEKNQKIADAHQFQFSLSDGCLCLVGIFLDFFNIKDGYQVLQNNKKFNPAGICGVAVSSGVFEENGSSGWIGH